MKLQVHCFGAARRWCGGEFVELELAASDATVADAEAALAARFPEFAALAPQMAYAIGDSLVNRTSALQPSDVLVLIAPVSGG